MASGKRNSCSIGGWERLAGVALFLVFLLLAGLLVYCLIARDPNPPPNVVNPPTLISYLVIYGISLLLFLTGVYLLNRGLKHYTWDEERISLGHPLGKTSMRWDEVAYVKLGVNVYSLYNAPQGRLFKIDLRSIRRDHGLRAYVERKLRPWLNTVAEEIADGDFFSLSATILGKGTYTFDALGFTEETQDGERRTEYEDIRFVFKDIINEEGPDPTEIHYFSTETATPLILASEYPDYFQVIFFLRQKLPHAQWEDLMGSKSPADPRAAYRFHLRRLIKYQRKLKPFLSIVCTLALILGASIYRNHTLGLGLLDGEFAMGSAVSLALALAHVGYYFFRKQASRSKITRIENLARSGKVELVKID